MTFAPGGMQMPPMPTFGAGPAAPGPSVVPQQPADSKLSPEQWKLLHEQGASNQQIKSLDDQMARSDALRVGPAKGRRVGSRNTFVAANPLEHLAHVFDKTQRGATNRKLVKARKEYEDKQVKHEQSQRVAAAELDQERRDEDTQFREDQLQRQRDADKARQAQAAASSAATLAAREAAQQRHEEIQGRLLDNEEASRKRHSATSKRIHDKDINTQTRDLRNRVDPLIPIGEAMKDFDKQIGPYMKSGAKSGEDVPGLGVFEGMNNPLGSTIRWTKDFLEGTGKNSAQNMASGLRRVINPILREGAGTAQTLTETRNILLSMGADGLNDDQVLLEAYPRIRAAMQRDLQNISAAYDPEAVQVYSDRMTKFGWNPLDNWGPINPPPPGTAPPAAVPPGGPPPGPPPGPAGPAIPPGGGVQAGGPPPMGPAGPPQQALPGANSGGPPQGGPPQQALPGANPQAGPPPPPNVDPAMWQRLSPQQKQQIMQRMSGAP